MFGLNAKRENWIETMSYLNHKPSDLTNCQNLAESSLKGISLRQQTYSLLEGSLEVVKENLNDSQ